MGRSHALLLAREGAKVVVADIDKTSAHETVEEIRKAGGSAIFVSLDVSKEDQWRSAISEVLSHFGSISVLVNNAGVISYGPLMETPLADWNRVFGINATGPFLGIREVSRVMKDAGGGVIVNISSVLGVVGAAGMVAYQASKGAVTTLTKAAAAELAQYNIRVNAVHPGLVETPMIAQFLNDAAVVDAMLGPTLIRRLGKPEEISYAVLFLASDESPYMTGSILTVDGGYATV
ncbi:SDR family NAD(P)-dependent oxidoreductase [Ferribacterium limneticum]|uniref:SDR family NAD(P)-dependent oxidoreductase n=1 Tax=Ferribacterium limneticum TaxID=76259 RepID=UPI00384D0B7C